MGSYGCILMVGNRFARTPVAGDSTTKPRTAAEPNSLSLHLALGLALTWILGRSWQVVPRIRASPMSSAVLLMMSLERRCELEGGDGDAFRSIGRCVVLCSGRVAKLIFSPQNAQFPHCVLVQPEVGFSAAHGSALAL